MKVEIKHSNGKTETIQVRLVSVDLTNQETVFIVGENKPPKRYAKGELQSFWTVPE